MSESTPVDWNMKMRLAADRVLRAMTLKRQSRVAVLASAALSVVATAQPSLLPPELIVLKDLLNVSAISSLLKEVAEHGNKLSDEEIATQMETLLPADQLDPLVIGQNDLLGVLTRQHSWQQQMLWLQEADGEAGARLLAGFAEMTGDLATIRNAIGTAATQEQMKALLRLITEEVLPLLTAAMQERYEMSGDFRGGMVNINSTVTIAWPEGQPYIPPPPPALGELPWPDYLPPGALIPFDRNPFFTGRGEELVELAALLLPMTNEGRSELVTGHSSLVTISTGIGGVGKTQLAIEFAYRFGRFFHGLHWVSAENPDAVDTAVAECGRRMRLHPTFGNLSLSDQVALTEAVWAGPEARLIILDNCEQPDVLARWRPKGGGARLLVTSRSGHWPRSLGAVEFPLDTLTRDQSVALLEAYLSPALSSELETRRSLLAAVAFELGDLPLALHLAGSFLESYASTPAGTLEALLAELRDPALSLRGAALTGRGTEGSPTKHELHVANTFLLSLRRLEDTAAGGEALAKALLARAACFAPGEPIPAGLLRATLSDNVTSLDVADALRALVGVGLLERVKAATQAAGTNEAYRLHRLVARFADGALAGEMTGAQRSVERVAQALLDRVWESKDPRELRLAIFHLRYIVNSASLREDAASLILINDLGLCLEISGDFAGGQLYHERALAIRERVLGPEHPDTAESLNNIGMVLQEQGDLAGARPYHERALAIWERVRGAEHPDTLIGLNNLGYLLLAQGDLAGALPYYERTLAIRERVLGPEHPDTALSLNNMGYLLQAMSDMARARPYHERALAIRERILGPEHPDTAQSLTNLGSLLQAMGDLPGARPYFERALVIWERVFGPEHPDTARGLNNMGYLLQAMGDLPGARPYFERALALREHILGPEHPSTALSLNNIGYLLQAMSDLAGARPYHERALAIRERVLGPEHPDTAESLNNIGIVLQEQGDLAGARLYFERALTILEAKLDPNHPYTQSVRANLQQF